MLKRITAVFIVVLMVSLPPACALGEPAQSGEGLTPVAAKQDIPGVALDPATIQKDIGEAAGQVKEAHEAVRENITTVRETIKELKENYTQQVEVVHQQAAQNITAVNLTVQDVKAVHGEVHAQIKETRAVIAENITELRAVIKEQKETFNAQVANLTAEVRAMRENQNEVRLAVHSLLAMGNLTGGIGPQVSAIAREFNNSVMATERAEQRIQARDAVTRFLAGGDETAAAELEAQVARNNAQIQNLTQLMQAAALDPDVQQVMQEQLQAIQQEQERLRLLAQQEKANRGIFGWLWK
jgi:poly-gamma-glutamate capsule biosynthesis protein CapA/YwtB (metallophosphatase superfamily)